VSLYKNPKAGKWAGGYYSSKNDKYWQLITNEIIHVKFGIIAIAHDSFASATKQLTSQEFALVNGQTVLTYQFNGHELVISFDNHKVCQISSGANRINWMVADSVQLNDKSNPPQNIVFEYPNGGRDT